jgi:L-ascorbate metabolism protein UlaG (beta-lactamase superfamily)
LVSSPGEYDVKGVTITGIPLKQSDGFVSVFLIESEGIKVLNLTHIKEFSIKEDELEDLGEIDVLIIPVGGEDVLGASEAAKIVNQIEAKIVIPSHYATDGVKIKLGSVDRFVKEMGGKVETMDKIILKKKELASTEETKVIILTN